MVVGHLRCDCFFLGNGSNGIEKKKRYSYYIRGDCIISDICTGPVEFFVNKTLEVGLYYFGLRSHFGGNCFPSFEKHLLLKVHAIHGVVGVKSDTIGSTHT